MNIVCVAGARPNFMKIKPVIDAIEAAGSSTVLVHTGQHYDASMSDVFFDDLGIRSPDHSLDVGSASHADQTARVMMAFDPLLERVRPDAVVVVGDVNSTLACALVAAKQGVRVAHVEAGLRSRDWSMPEEVNRVVADRLSHYLFASSPDAVDNLTAEGYRTDQVHLVGNVMIDTLLANRDRALARPIMTNLGLRPQHYALVTLHRPANVDDPESLRTLVEMLADAAGGMPIVFPVHPRTQQRLIGLAIPSSVRLIEPAGYLDFICLEANAQVVLTDSGGVQEETTALGVPCLTLRENTERPITVDEGTNSLVGRDPLRIRAAMRRVVDGLIEKRCPKLWDGRAATRIAEVLLDPDAVPADPTSR